MNHSSNRNSSDTLLFLPDGSVHRIPNRRELDLFPSAEVLPEGSPVDWARDPADPSGLALIFWRDGTVHSAKRIQIGEKIISPPTVDKGILYAVQLPSRVVPCGGPSELIHLIEGHLGEAFDLAEESLRLVSRFALSTWFPEKLERAPLLGIIGPYESGKTSLIRFLHAICRRAVLVGDLTPASIYLLTDQLKPTLLIDEADFTDSRMSAEVKRLLRTGDTPGVPAVRNGKLFDTFCPKVLAARQRPDDAALASRMGLIRMSPAHRKLRRLDAQWLKQVADELQPKLLWARFHYFDEVQTSPDFESRAAHLTPRMQSLAQALAGPLLGNRQAEDELIASFEEQDEEARLERCEDREWLVAREIFAISHEPAHAVLAGGIARRINDTMVLEGADMLSARAVGAALDILGIRRVKLGNRGRGVKFTSGIREKAHELARNYRISRRDLLSDGYEAEYGGAPCALCERYGLTGGLKFVSMPRPARVPVGRRSEMFQTNTD